MADLEGSMNRSQKIELVLEPTNDAGQPARVDGQAEFVVQSGDCTIERTGDLSAFIVSGDVAGDSEVLYSADADLGQGVRTISGTALVHVTDLEATGLGARFGTPVPKA